MALLRLIYAGLTLILSVLLFVPFLISARGRKRIGERYGFWNLNCPDSLIWFHAASVGEMRGLMPVIRQVKAKSSQKILVTASSVEGLERAREVADFVRLLPFDNILWLSIALTRLKVALFVFSETEIWPALLEKLLKRDVNICMINATISDYSWSWFRSARFYLAPLLSKFSLLLAVDQISAERLVLLGAKSERVSVSGNSKFDLEPSVRSKAEALERKHSFFSEELPVLVLGSLRPGEELVWFPAIARATHAGLNFQVVAAPRHPEKVDLFAKALSAERLIFARRSESRSSPSSAGTSPASRIVLLDSLGELESCYSFADVAFIGGTLEDWGGHNPLEAAAYGAYICMGPHRKKVEGLAAALFEQGAGREILDTNQAEQLIIEMCRDPKALRFKGEQGIAIFKALNGAASRISEKLIPFSMSH